MANRRRVAHPTCRPCATPSIAELRCAWPRPRCWRRCCRHEHSFVRPTRSSW